MRRAVLRDGAGIWTARARMAEPRSWVDMSRIVVNVLTPSLMFVNAGPLFSEDSLRQIWPIPVAAVLFTMAGFAVGFLVRAITRTKGGLGGGVVMAVTFNNVGAMPLAIVAAIAAMPSGPFAALPDAIVTGTRYVTVYLCVRSILTWSIGYRFFEGRSMKDRHPAPSAAVPPAGDESTGAATPTEAAAGSSTDDSTLLSPDARGDIALHPVGSRKMLAAVAGGAEHDAAVKSDDDETILDERDISRQSLVSQQGENGTSAGTGRSPYQRVRRSLCDAWLDVAARWHTCTASMNSWAEHHPRLCALMRPLAAVSRALRKLLTPPVAATILAFVIGMIPPLADLFFTPTGGLAAITTALGTLSKAVVPIQLLVLGSNLSAGPLRSTLKKRTLFLVLLARLGAYACVAGGRDGLEPARARRYADMASGRAGTLAQL